MWCKNCNIETYELNCPICGAKTADSVPVEFHWCKSCKVPVIFSSNQIDKGCCPLCSEKTKYIYGDIRPVFPEERLFIELLQDITPNSLSKSSVWYSTGGLFVDGKIVKLDINKYKNQNHELLSRKIEYYSKDNTYEYFNSYIKAFCKANEYRLNNLINEAQYYIKQTSTDYDDNIVIRMSGGKDSITLNDIVRNSLSDSRIVSLFENTSLDMPSTKEYLDRYRKINPSDVLVVYDNKYVGRYYKRFSDALFIDELKSLYNNQNVLVFYDDRDKNKWSWNILNRTEYSKIDDKIIQAFPLKYWNDIDVWLYILSKKIDFNDAHRYGFSSVDRIDTLNKNPRYNLLFHVYMPEALAQIKEPAMRNYEKELKVIKDKDVFKLKKLITEHGDFWENYKKSKALFMDCFPEDKILWHSLLSCIEELIPQDISARNLCTQTDYHRYIKKLKGSIGCTDEVAKKAVLMWIYAIGIKYESERKEDESSEQQEIMGRTESIFPDKDMSIDELELSVRSYNCLKRAGINTVGELISKTREEKMGVRNFGRKSLEEVLEKLNELGFELSTGEDKYTEKNHPGRDKCDKLRKIRKKIAEANGIDFEPAECHHTGPCLGTCPVCDEEIKYLDEQLQKKKACGEDIILNGLAINDIKEAGCNIEPNDFDYIEEMGEDVPYYIKDSDTEVNNSEGDIEMGMDTPDDIFDGDIW